MVLGVWFTLKRHSFAPYFRAFLVFSPKSKFVKIIIGVSVLGEFLLRIRRMVEKMFALGKRISRSITSYFFFLTSFSALGIVKEQSTEKEALKKACL